MKTALLVALTLALAWSILFPDRFVKLLSDSAQDKVFVTLSSERF